MPKLYFSNSVSYDVPRQSDKMLEKKLSKVEKDFFNVALKVIKYLGYF